MNKQYDSQYTHHSHSSSTQVIRLTSLLFCLLIGITASAVPAKYLEKKVRLRNGEEITVVQQGDETFRMLTTLSGTPVLKNADGTFRLAPEASDSLLSSWHRRLVRRNSLRAATSPAAIASRSMQKAKLRDSASGHPNVLSGKRRGIAILVNFSDCSFARSHTNTTVSQMFNQHGYSNNNHYGSIHDYFLDASYGQFDLEYDVYGPVTISQPIKYYGENVNDDDARPSVMVAEAVQLANEQYDIDWHRYDWNGDGEVEHVVCLYAGYGEHAGGSDDTIWAHEWSLRDALLENNEGNGPVRFGDCLVNTYVACNELSGSRGTNMDGIGTLCHEISHTFGLPDLYNTEYSGGTGMAYWDIMAAGSFNGPNFNGEIPPGYTAYERWFLGWMTPIELTHPYSVTDMPPLQDAPVAYIIYNDHHRDEFFLLENRQPEGWFSYVRTSPAGHGLFIYHVDYDEKAWEENEINTNSKHQRLAFIPASGLFSPSASANVPTYASLYASQLFPGLHKVTTFDGESHASCGGTLFHPATEGSPWGKGIYDIHEFNDRISFTFTAAEAPDAISAATDDDSTLQYYSLSGQRLSATSLPSIYIVRKGDRVLKKSAVR